MPQRVNSQIDSHLAHQSHFHSERLAEHTTLLQSIKTNTENINVNVDTLEVNTDGLEGLATTTNTKLNGGLPSALTGSGNLKVCIQELGNEGSEKLNVDVGDDITQLPTALTGEGNLKVSIQEDHTHNLATSANQTTTNGHLATIAGDTTAIDGKITTCNTGAVVVSSSVLPSGASTASLQGGGLPSALSSDNLKVSLKETITVPVSNTTLTNLNNCIDSNELQVDIVASALPSGASTASLQGGGLPSALSSDNLKVSLKETITVPVSNTTLTNLNNCIDTNELQVDIVASALPSGAATESSLSSLNGKISQGSDVTLSNAQQVLCYGRDNGGTLDALRTDASGHLEVVVDDFVKGQAAMAASFPVTIASNQSNLNVAIASGGFDGAVTNAGLTSLAAAVNSDRVDVNIAAGGFDGAVTNAGLTALNGTIGLNKVNVNLSSDAVGLSTSALQGTLNTKIDTIDSQIDLLEGTNTIKDVEWLSNASISNQALSDVLDTEGYERVFIYGENSSSVSANNFKVFGSNESSGTYYSVGQLAVVTSDSGRYLLREDTPVADMPSPRFLKIFNNTGSSQTITKLRAVMSHKLRYV